MMKRHIFIFILALCKPVLADKSPFDLEHVFPEDMHGWFSPYNRIWLQEYITTQHPKKVVEVGSWLGLSAIFMAKLLDNDAKIYCIDPWAPYADMAAMPDCQIRMKYAYERFLSNCIHHKVTAKVVPMRMPSLQAVEYFASDIDLIYIDGSHKPEDVFNDVMAWYPKLSARGVMCGDDIGWPGTLEVLQKAAILLNVTLKSKDWGNFWWFEKNK